MSVEEILWRGQIYITTLQMLSYGATCFSAFNGMNFGNVVEFSSSGQFGSPLNTSSIHIVKK